MAKGIEIILIGADGATYSLYRSLPFFDEQPRDGETPFTVELAADPTGFLAAPLTGVVEQKQSSMSLARSIQRVDVGKRAITLPLMILPHHEGVSFFEVKSRIEKALTFRLDPNDPEAHLARLIVRSGDTEEPSSVQSRYIEVCLQKPISWNERLDHTGGDGWMAVASCYGSPFWMEVEPRRSIAVGALIEGTQARLFVTLENPGDVAVPLTWTFKGIAGKGTAGTYGVPDVKLIGGRFNRRVDSRQRLLITPLIECGETVQVSSDRDRPPIMSDRSKERSRELLTLSRGTYLRNKLPEYTQPIELGVSYHKGAIPNFPPKTIRVEWTPLYYGAW